MCSPSSSNDPQCGVSSPDLNFRNCKPNKIEPDYKRREILARPSVRHLLASGFDAVKTKNEKILRNVKKLLCISLSDTLDPSMTIEEWCDSLAKFIDDHRPYPSCDHTELLSDDLDRNVTDPFEQCQHQVHKMLNFRVVPQPISASALNYIPSQRILELSKPRRNHCKGGAVSLMKLKSISEQRINQQNDYIKKLVHKDFKNRFERCEKLQSKPKPKTVQCPSKSSTHDAMASKELKFKCAQCVGQGTSVRSSKTLPQNLKTGALQSKITKPQTEKLPQILQDHSSVKDENSLSEENTPLSQNNNSSWKDDLSLKGNNSSSDLPLKGDNSSSEDDSPPLEDDNNNKKEKDNSSSSEDDNSSSKNDGNSSSIDDTPPLEDDNNKKKKKDNSSSSEDDNSSSENDDNSSSDLPLKGNNSLSEDDTLPLEDDNNKKKKKDNSSSSEDDNSSSENDDNSSSDLPLKGDNSSSEDDTPPLEDDNNKKKKKDNSSSSEDDNSSSENDDSPCGSGRICSKNGARDCSSCDFSDSLSSLASENNLLSVDKSKLPLDNEPELSLYNEPKTPLDNEPAPSSGNEQEPPLENNSELFLDKELKTPLDNEPEPSSGNKQEPPSESKSKLSLDKEPNATSTSECVISIDIIVRATGPIINCLLVKAKPTSSTC